MKRREPITALELWSLDACQSEIKIFEREWPEGCAITKKNALRADRLELGSGFLAWRLLDRDTYHRYFISRQRPRSVNLWMCLTGRG